LGLQTQQETLMANGQPTHTKNGGQGFGGGEQGERLEGSLTDGGAVPGRDEDEDRRFGAGKDLPADAEDLPPQPPEA
jgi:hypothetical protein